MTIISTALRYFLARFSEPSSYAGLGAFLAALGLNLPESMMGQLALFLAAGCGLLGLFLKDRGIIKSLALVAVLAGALSACSVVKPEILTAAAKASCEAQAHANTATALATMLGKHEAAEASSKVSAILGWGCVW